VTGSCLLLPEEPFDPFYNRGCKPVSIGHNTPMRIGFTGSREGMTEQQKQTL